MTERQFHDNAEGTTPDTAEVRERWMKEWRGYTHQQGIEAFDRWLNNERRTAYLEGKSDRNWEQTQGEFTYAYGVTP